jgi:hypothetical protein
MPGTLKTNFHYLVNECCPTNASAITFGELALLLLFNNANIRGK